MAQGIFISYRRETGSTMARMLYDRLRLEKQYSCFLDVEKLNAGNFREHIDREMDKCDILLLVLSRNALDRCSNPNDNIRQEIQGAFDKGLAVIPVTTEDFTWPEKMPEGLERVKDYNSIPYVQVYSEYFFERLYSFIDTSRGVESGGASPQESGKSGEGTLPQFPDGSGEESTSQVPDKISDTIPGSPAPVPDSPAPRAAKKISGLTVLLGFIAIAAVIALVAVLLGRGGSVPSETSPGPSPSPTATVLVTANPETTAGPAAPEKTAAPAETGTLPAANMDDAPVIPLDTRITGTASDGKIWYYAFRTGSGTDYRISAVNKSGIYRLFTVVCEEDGTERGRLWASSDGQAKSEDITLSPDTVYYLKVYNNGNNTSGIYTNDTPLDFALVVRSLPDAAEEALWGGKRPGASPDNVPGNSQDDAALIPLNTRILGTASDGKIWYYAFRTDSGTDYRISAVNKSALNNLFTEICDESGKFVDRVMAEKDGQAKSVDVTLDPDTVYYLKVFNNGKNTSGVHTDETPLEYALAVRSLPDAAAKTLWVDKEAEVLPDNLPGNSQDDAGMIPLNTKITGTTLGRQPLYYSFRTGSGTVYRIFMRIVTNFERTCCLSVVIYDESGETVDSMEILSDSFGQSERVFDITLSPDTVYYLKVYSEGYNEKYLLDSIPAEYEIRIGEVEE